MATYVIGDIQGCFVTWQKLLALIKFDKKHDRQILLGDLVNRGPRSLEVLRDIFANQDSISLVLGNHDLLLIALFLGLNSDKAHTMHELLNAPDAPALILWLRNQPLLIKNDQGFFVHAGILPSESLSDAEEGARLAHEKLKGPEALPFLRQFYERRAMNPALPIQDQALKALSYLTLIRMCRAPDAMASYDQDLARAPKDLKPWFMLRHHDGQVPIYFGHWAALGLYRYQNYQCLDSGCAWGNKLSALRLEDNKIFQVDNSEKEPF